MDNLLLGLIFFLIFGLAGVGGGGRFLDRIVSAIPNAPTIVPTQSNTLPSQTISPTSIPTVTPIPPSYSIQQDNSAQTLTTPSCTISYINAPTGDVLGKQVAQVCQDNLSLISQRLGNSSFSLPVSISFNTSQSAPGVTNGSNISLSSTWFIDHPDDLGLVVHEMTHVVQAYPSGNSVWLIEGIADYIRYALGFTTSSSFAHCSSTESYTIGYWCTAALLQYIEKTYDPNIVFKLNTALRNGTYDDSMFITLTTKDLTQLFNECKGSNCKAV